MPFKKNTTKISVTPPKQVRAAIDKAKSKPVVVVGILALLLLVGMLAFTLKGSASFTRSRKAANVNVVVAAQTPQEIAEEATAALQKGDTQTFLIFWTPKSRTPI